MSLEKHIGDCTIYSSLINGNPEDGICTCGYGRKLVIDKGDYSEMYSNKLIRKLESKVKLTAIKNLDNLNKKSERD